MKLQIDNSNYLDNSDTVNSDSIVNNMSNSVIENQKQSKEVNMITVGDNSIGEITFDNKYSSSVQKI